MSNAFTNLPARPYRYFVSDSAGCVAGGTSSTVGTFPRMWCVTFLLFYLFIISITEITAYTTSNSSCQGGSTGSVSIFASGGVAPYTYMVSLNFRCIFISLIIRKITDFSSGFNQTSSNIIFTNLPSGNYTYWVFDHVGCSLSGTVIVSPTSTFFVVLSKCVNISNCSFHIGCYEKRYLR